jgi:hypothetical protein
VLLTPAAVAAAEKATVAVLLHRLSSLRTAARAVTAAAETFLLVLCAVTQQNRGHAHSRASSQATSRVAAALRHGWLQRYAIDEFRLSTAARAHPTLWRGRQSQESRPTRRRRGQQQRRLRVVCGGRRGGGVCARCARSRVRLESGAHVYVRLFDGDDDIRRPPRSCALAAKRARSSLSVAKDFHAPLPKA